jgi:hypothetical protein
MPSCKTAYHIFELAREGLVDSLRKTQLAPIGPSCSVNLDLRSCVHHDSEGPLTFHHVLESSCQK